MKTTRIEFVATPEFKASLHAQAAAAGMSVAELIRRRFTPASEEEVVLTELASELRQATERARQELSRAVSELDTLLDELRQRRQALDRLIA